VTAAARWPRRCVIHGGGCKVPRATGTHPRTHRAPCVPRLRKPKPWWLSFVPDRRNHGPCQPLTRQQKITLGEMRGSGVRGVLVYCSDYRCSHSTAISADRWADHVRSSDIEPRFTCQACADVRPGFGQCLYVKRTGRHRGRPGYSGACVRRSRYRRCPTEATTQRAKSPTPIQTRSETISNSFA
jgi:hypothetical protein